SDLLSNEMLFDTIVNGLYNKDEIIKSVDSSRHFIKPETKGPWFTIMNFDSIETVKVDNALKELFAKFENLDITERGEILHSINLLFMLSDAKHIKKDINEVYGYFLE
ncbi:TPA: hypothetical protein ONE32_004702, partial [Enterobacter cloacae subsp. cloacae]|nr:hypothetical protein [Enterobacter cloacae subsp. cloacae]